MPVMPASHGLMTDCESGPMCSDSEESTSSASRVLPLWNSTPLRSLKCQTFASGEASHDSASSGCASNFLEYRTRVLLVIQIRW